MNNFSKILKLDRTNPSYPPPKAISFIAKQMLERWDYTNYAQTEGLVDLRKAIVLKLKRDNNIEASPDQIVVTSGSSSAILLSLLLLSRRKGVILCPRPCYPAYFRLLQYMNREIVFYDPDRINTILSAAKKYPISLCIVNTPSNPTGLVLDTHALNELVESSQNYDFPILSDEAYENYAYKAKHISPGSLDMGDKVISTFSFSKTYSLSGWRIGYVVLPNSLVKEAQRLHRAMAINTPLLSQFCALAALNDLDYPRKIHAYYARQKKQLSIMLNENLIEYNNPSGGLCFWINISKTNMNGDEFAALCLSEGSLVIQPGSYFQNVENQFVRASFSGLLKENLEGFERLIYLYKRSIN